VSSKRSARKRIIFDSCRLPLDHWKKNQRSPDHSKKIFHAWQQKAERSHKFRLEFEKAQLDRGKPR
jgi:hypothetical protein